MNKTLLALAAVTALTSLPIAAQAEDASPLSFNVGAVTDYRYRGITQTRFKPALQGGADYALPNGFYVGAWASTIKWIKDAGGDASVEIDVYGGYKTEIAKDVTLDVGLLQYIYPNAKTAAWDAVYKDPNTLEVYGAVTFGPATAKLSYSLTNLFGNYDFTNSKSSKGSYYLDLSATFDVSGISITPHLGYQKVTNIANASYADYSLTASKDISGVVVSAAIVGTDAKEAFYVAPGGRFAGRSTLVLGVKKTF
jgi:uncharacterized protein (TIGR02001 family)